MNGMMAMGPGGPMMISLAASLAVAIAAVATERSTVTIGRLAFLKWFALVLLAPIAISLAAALLGAGMLGAILSSVVGVCLTWPLYRAAVRRARDVGWGKLVPALAIVPVVSVIVFILLSVVKGRPAAAGAAVEAD